LIKAKFPSIPVIMITKSEEEYIMEEAIGSKISDYLIKPVNPNQILLSIKKNLDTTKLVNAKSTSNYQKEFREIGMQLNDRLDKDEWAELYQKLVYWELELEKSKDSSMEEISEMQKSETNKQFGKFVEKNYTDWLTKTKEDPIISQKLMAKYGCQELKKSKEHLFFSGIDNLRYDQ